jgi:CheY-like chemotaxis protein
MAEILVVDDDEMARVWLGAVLEKAGHQVLFASDGEAALQIYMRNPADLVIADLSMPVLNGLRLIQELVESYPSACIVAISGVNKEQLDLAEDFGAKAAFPKPFYPKELLQAVATALEQRDKDVWG